MAERAPTRADSRLVGWKRISNYLGCSERTARRWEQDEGLPVHRQMHETKPTVYAQPAELDDWVASRQKDSAAAAERGTSNTRRFVMIAAIMIAIVVGAVAVRSVNSLEASNASSPMSNQAVDLYERGRSLWLQRGVDPNRRAIALLEQAVELEPQYAEAWSALASAWLTYPTYDLEFDEQRAFDEAVFAADKALRLDDGLSEPRSIMATVALNRNDWVSAEDVYLEVVRSDPDNSTGHLWLAGFYRETGRMIRAEESLSVARSLDPNSPPVLIEDAMNLQIHPDPDVPSKALDRLWSDMGIQFPVVWFGNWNMQLRRGAFDEAKRFLDFTPHVAFQDVLTAYVEARESKDETSLDEIADALKSAHADGLEGWLAYTLLDQIYRPGEAMDILEATLDRNETLDIAVIMLDPLYPLARQTERFAGLVERYGLIEYWQQRSAPDLCEAEADYPYCRRIRM